MVVCPGTYHEQVVISKPVSLEGQRATIDEAGVIPGFQLTLPGLGKQTIFAGVAIFSSDVRFSGFTVTHAQGEGILAAGLGGELTGISISYSAVVHNDLGFGVPKPKSITSNASRSGRFPVTAVRAFTSPASPSLRSRGTSSPSTPAGC